MSKEQKRTHRARRMLEAAASQYAKAWNQIDQFRAERGKGLPDWPDWCFIPMAAGYAIASGGGHNRLSFERMHHPAVLTALASWRMTQGIFRFDETLRDALLDTPLSGSLPVQHLYRLPHWCVYIETPGLTWQAEPLAGFFAHLECDLARDGIPELRLLLDLGADARQPFAPSALLPVPVILTADTLEEALNLLSDSAQRQGSDLGLPASLIAEADRPAAGSIAPLISLLLYLCAEPEVSQRGAPIALRNPQPVRTRREGRKTLAATASTEIDIGVRMGSALRAALNHRGDDGSSGDGPGASGRTVIPHVRAQHWHSYWSGPKIGADGSPVPLHQRKLDVRWMPPIPVAVESIDDMPATIRPVR
ncbi:AcrVA2 family anti-CRISPR protein [Pseudomonas aeruginosa]